VQSVFPWFEQYLELTKITPNIFTKQVSCQPLLAYQVFHSDKTHRFGFCDTGAPLGPADFIHLFSQLAGQNYPVGEFFDYSFAIQLAKQGKYIQPKKDAMSILSTFEHGYIIDTDSFLTFLKNQLKAHYPGQIREIEEIQLNLSDKNGDVNQQADLQIDCRERQSQYKHRTIQSVSWQCQLSEKPQLNFQKQVQLTQSGWLLALKPNTDSNTIHFQLNLTESLELTQSQIQTLVQQHSTDKNIQAVIPNSIQVQEIIEGPLIAFNQSAPAFNVHQTQANSWAMSSIDYTVLFIMALLDCIALFKTPDLFQLAFNKCYQDKLTSVHRYQNMLSDTLKGTTTNDSINLFLASGRIKQLDPDLIQPAWVAGLLMSLGYYPKSGNPFARQLPNAQISQHLQQIRQVLQRTSQSI